MEDADQRTQKDWDAMSVAALQAEWEARPRFDRPPYPRDRNRFNRLTKVRSELFARLHTTPPDGVTFGTGKPPKDE